LAGTDSFSGRITNNNFNYILGQDSNYKAQLRLFENDNPDFKGRFQLSANIEECFYTDRESPDGHLGSIANTHEGFMSYVFDGINTRSELYHDSSGLYNDYYKNPQNDNYYVQKKYITDNYLTSTGVSALLANYYTKSETYNKAEVDAKLSAVYRPKGSVANFASLPTTGNTEGDVWNILDTGANYVWVLNVNNTGVPDGISYQKQLILRIMLL
jgi:hypothetical protein